MSTSSGIGTEEPGHHINNETKVDDQDVEAAKPDEDQFKPAVDLSPAQIKLVMLAVILSLTVVYLDTFILSPALPTIAKELSANDPAYAWIGAALLLTMAISVPILGKASDLCGRQSTMIATNLIFLLGTFIGGFAHSVAMLIAGRLIQGIGCGGLIVVANICVIDLFSPRNRGTYISMIGTVSAVASAAGPILGGALATKATWRWCFWINLPIAAISFFLQFFFLKLSKPTIPLKQGLKEVDWLGAFLLTASTTMVLVGLQLGGTGFPWASATVLCLIVVGTGLFAAFCCVEKYLAKQPLIPLSIFANISRAATVLVMVAQAIVSSGVKYFLVLYFQLVFGLTPLESAIYYLPYAAGLGFVLPFIGWFIKKTGKYRLLICFGAFVLALGAGLLIDTKYEVDWPLIIIPQLILATGAGLTYQSTTIAFQAQIKHTQGTAGQSAFQLLRNFSQMLSIILGQVVFQAEITNRIQWLHDNDLNGSFANTLASGNIFNALPLIQTLPPQQIATIRQLLADSFRDMWIFYAAISLVGLLVSSGIIDVHMT